MGCCIMKRKDGEKTMWKHREEAEDQIRLHDCRATYIAAEQNRILMGFADGFWLIRKTAYNPTENTLKTAGSQLVFHLDDQYADDVTVFIFRQKQLRGKKWVQIRECKDIQWLMKMINQKGAQLEIIDEYGYYRRRLYIGDLILRHPTDRMECQVEIPAI